AGWTRTLGNYDVAAVSGTAVPARNFGNFQNVNLSGQVFQDSNGDGIKNETGTGLSGWTIFLDTNTNGSLNAGEASTVSDATGNYSFANLGPGTYHLREVLQASWAKTLGNYDVVVGGQGQQSGQSLGGLDFGNIQANVYFVDPSNPS